MRTTVMLLAVLLVADCASSGRTATGTAAQKASAKDKAALAKVLAGRVAGPPQDCVAMDQLGGDQAFGSGVILFRGLTREVVWVNRPPHGCLFLEPGRALKIEPTMGRLCRGDAVSVVDPVSGEQFSGCDLGQFTPYRLAH